MVFAIPNESKVYFGTTDTDYDGDFADPDITQGDVDYLLRIINRRFPEADIQESDIEASWSGLRPLISSPISRQEDTDAVSGATESVAEEDLDPSEVSRGSDLSVSRSGLLTLAGGKITDYRKMALGAMEMILERLAEKGIHYDLIESKTYPVSGGWFNPYNIEGELERFAGLARGKGFSDAEAKDLADLYGSNTPKVLTYLDEAKEFAEKYDYPVFIATSLLYSLDNEMTYTLNDYFTRRTTISLFRSDQVDSLIEPVASTIQEVLDLNDEVMEEQKEEYAKEREQMTLAHLN
jgi:alpha-glycerophosphate oxidase